jgi:hypothetical protein
LLQSSPRLDSSSSRNIGEGLTGRKGTLVACQLNPIAFNAVDSKTALAGLVLFVAMRALLARGVGFDPGGMRLPGRAITDSFAVSVTHNAVV